MLRLRKWVSSYEGLLSVSFVRGPVKGITLSRVIMEAVLVLKDHQRALKRED